jgi:hypothetical protein
MKNPVRAFALFTAALVLGLPLGSAAASTTTLTAEEKAAGWRPLFDGQSLNGWLDYYKRPWLGSFKECVARIRFQEAAAGEEASLEEVVAKFYAPEITLSGGIIFRHGDTIRKKDCEIMMNHVGANYWRYFPGVGVYFINKD